MFRTHPVLIEIRRPLKAFMALALVFIAVNSRAAEGLGQPPDDSPSEPRRSRNFLKACLDDAVDLLHAPQAWSGRDWAAMALPASGLFVLIKTDPQLYPRLRGKQDWLESSMPIATDLGDGLYAAGGSAVLWGLGEATGSERLADSSSEALESMAFCGIAAATLKYAFKANRPTDRDDRHDFFSDDIHGSPSFPSGHTLVAFALAETYGATYGRYWTYPLAAVVGYSRIYLGVHWPSDVAAGALLGAALGHAAVLSAEEKGAPRGWKFSLAPMAGGALAMGQIKY